jgi:hypothetical protein
MKNASSPLWSLSHLPYRSVLGLKIKQRIPLFHNDVLYFSDENGVIARVLAGMQSALQISERPVQHRRSMLGAVKARAGFFFGSIMGAVRKGVILGVIPR